MTINSFLDLVQSKLNNEFPNSEIKLECPRNDGRHFNLTISSQMFDGLNRVARSRLVYVVLEQYIGTDQIHALSMKLTSPNDK